MQQKCLEANLEFLVHFFQFISIRLHHLTLFSAHIFPFFLPYFSPTFLSYISPALGVIQAPLEEVAFSFSNYAEKSPHGKNYVK